MTWIKITNSQNTENTKPNWNEQNQSKMRRKTGQNAVKFFSTETKARQEIVAERK